MRLNIRIIILLSIVIAAESRNRLAKMFWIISGTLRVA